MNAMDNVITGEPPMIEGPGDTPPEPTAPSEEPNPVVMGEVKDPNPNPEPPVTAPESGAEEPNEAPVPEDSETEPEMEPEVPQEPVTATDISYYADEDLTVNLFDPPYFGAILYNPGTEIYTKVVLSREVPIVLADGRGKPGSPRIRYRYPSDPRFDGVFFTYRIRAQGSPLQSGDARPLGGAGDTFICKYVLPPDAGSHQSGIDTFVGTFDFYEREGLWVLLKGKAFDITDPPLISTLLAGADETHPAPEGGPGDFIGQVCVPFSASGDSLGVYPVANVTVTITTGPRSGEKTTTDRGGYYLFPDVDGDELYLRAEREHFEPTEVIAHRTNRTTLQVANGIYARRTSWGVGSEPLNPGVILIGQRWPEEIRFIFDEILLPDDLRLFVDDGSIFTGLRGGGYGPGEVSIRDNEGADASNGVILHEIMHAHQHALAIVEVDRESLVFDWYRTAEARAYAQAQEKDWREYGKTSLDKSFESLYHPSNHLLEIAADVAATYWGIDYLGGISYLRTKAPNRYRWAQEWLNKRY